MMTNAKKKVEDLNSTINLLPVNTPSASPPKKLKFFNIN